MREKGAVGKPVLRQRLVEADLNTVRADIFGRGAFHIFLTWWLRGSLTGLFLYKIRGT